jgi:hypothetical protein
MIDGRHRLILWAALLVLALGALRGSARAQANACADCNADGASTISDLIIGVSIALGAQPATACPSFDRNSDGAVMISELIAALNDALDGCVGAASPTPTATVSAVPATATPTPTTAGGDAVPTTPAALLEWLRAGRYLGWPAESAPHPSAGPHGGSVRTYLNDLLFASLDAGLPSHPAGAVAVKELYGSGSTITGWAVMVKLQDDSDAGRGWYWYEGFGSGTPFSGVGLGVCTGCHSRGRDFVRIPFPLL